MEFKTIDKKYLRDFKETMTNIEISGVHALVADWLSEYEEFMHGGELEYSHNEASRIFGFAYTSSSGFAMVNVCNDVCIHYEGHELKVQYFAITINNILVMVTEDGEENRIYFEI